MVQQGQDERQATSVFADLTPRAAQVRREIGSVHFRRVGVVPFLPAGYPIGHEVGDVRQGKYIEVDLSETDPAKAKVIVEQMCKDLLANTVIENYSYEIG